jgi:hypothetical protein
MTKQMKDEADKDFGEVVTRRCSFCDKTYDAEKFFAIPDEDSNEYLMTASMKAYTSSLFSKKSKEPKDVNEGICLKCMLRGISKVCRNDADKIKECFDLYLKKEIVNSLDK